MRQTPWNGKIQRKPMLQQRETRCHPCCNVNPMTLDYPGSNPQSYRGTPVQQHGRGGKIYSGTKDRTTAPTMEFFDLTIMGTHSKIVQPSYFCTGRMPLCSLTPLYFVSFATSIIVYQCLRGNSKRMIFWFSNHVYFIENTSTDLM